MRTKTSTKAYGPSLARSEEHTSELQSHRYLLSLPTRRSSDLDLSSTRIRARGSVLRPRGVAHANQNKYKGLWAIVSVFMEVSIEPRTRRLPGLSGAKASLRRDRAGSPRAPERPAAPRSAPHPPRG